jgi:hypothetical protein
MNPDNKRERMSSLGKLSNPGGIVKPIAPPYLRSPMDRRRVGAAMLASVMALGCALPVAAASGETLPAGGGALSVLDEGGKRTS